jgi:Tol biopolymer transport system component
MNSRILSLGLVAVAAAVAVVLAVTLWPTGNNAQGASGAQIAASPTPSPAVAVGPGKLAYERNGGIYLANWDGSDPVRIANGGGEGHTWSPDGRYLAYRGETGNGASRHGTVNISDAQGHLVASFPGAGWKIAWSPDSTRVATWLRVGRTIGIYGLDGVRQRVLTLPRGLEAPGDFDPVWSPDGGSLIIPHGVEIPLDGSAPRQVPASDPRSHWIVSYSPNGARVAYADYYNPPVELAVAAADGSRARVLVRGVVNEAVWSPTGDRIAFDVPTGEARTDMGPATELRVVDVASGKVTTLTGAGSYKQAISFSPDGARILFSKTSTSDVSSLWSINADGSDPRRLVSGTFWGEWQPKR